MSKESQIRSSLEAYFDPVPGRNSGRELAFVCPEPGCGDQSGNRSVNVDSGRTNCWRCNKGGDYFAWARRLGFEIEQDDAGGPSVSVDHLQQMLGEVNRVGVVRTTGGFSTGIELPQGFTPLAPSPSNAFEKWIGRMAIRKNLEYTDFHAAGVGFSRVSTRWERFAIFPVVEWGRTVYYQGRTYIDIKGESTKQFPSKFECALGARHWVYNIDELRRDGGVAIVVESILNVLSLKKELAIRGMKGFVPVAVFKHKVSQEQLHKLAACKGLKEVCMLYDEDAIASVYAECRRLLGRVKMTYVKMPRKVDANDDAILAVNGVLDRRAYSDSAALLDALEVIKPSRSPAADANTHTNRHGAAGANAETKRYRSASRVSR